MTAGNGAIKQIWYRHGTANSNDYETYVRTYSGTWSNWVKLLNDKETGSYTMAEGQYTTASWATGTNTCTWTAPKTGLYIVWVYYINADDNACRVYKQFHAKGTATRLVSDILLYQEGADSTSESPWNKIAGGTFSTLVQAQAGQTIIPYVHTPVANLKWNVKIVGMFIK